MEAGPDRCSGLMAARCRPSRSPCTTRRLGFARLADPTGLPERRANSLRHIFKAMSSYPEMVAGPGEFDTMLMEAGDGKFVSKGGAEGYQGLAVAPGVLSPNSPGIGIAIKISDGDLTDGLARWWSWRCWRSWG